jgi:hypothetical protein
VPNVAIAMLCASDAPTASPPTTCDGRNSTRMSSSALTHACAATKCAISNRQRAGANAVAAIAAPIAPIAHGPNVLPLGDEIKVSALATSSAARIASA